MEVQWAIYVACMSVVWLISLIFRSLEYLYWWQLKEYRPDRMQAHLSTHEGRSFFYGTRRKVRIGFLLIVLVNFLVMWGANTFLSQNLIDTVYLYYFTILFITSILMTFWWGYEVIDGFRQIARTGLRRPKFTKKALVIWLIAGGLTAIYGLGPLLLFYPGNLLFAAQISPEIKYWLALPYFPGVYLLFVFGFQVGYVLGLTILDLFLPLVFRAVLLFFSPFTFLGKSLTANRAKSRIAAMDSLLKIGITGSYGKSGTKDLLAALLASRYKVHKTPQNHNTLIGVAQTINRDLDSQHEIFVIEMGAYKVGEIRSICNIAAPDISIVTGVNEQHLALFGSMENTRKAKYEIVEALAQVPVASVQVPGSKETFRPLAVFNADDANCVEISTWFKGEKMFYSAKGRYKVGGVKCKVLALDIKTQIGRVEFDLVDNREAKGEAQKQHIVLKANGKHNVNNFLAAACVALTFGFRPAELAKLALEMPTLPGGIRIGHGLNGCRIIDDSYSSNPDGFLAALDLMQDFKGGRRIVLTKGMQELGDQSLKQHRRVGEAIGQSADAVLILSRTYEEGLRQGIGKSKRKIKTAVYEDAQSALDFLRAYLKKDDVVLLEGRMSSRIVKGLAQAEDECKSCPK